MKAIRIVSPKNIEIFELPLPEINNGDEVLIKVKSAGICGTDVHIYHGGNPVASYPRIIGHEFAGEVVKAGNRVIDIKKGDHVVVDPVISCGHCYPCKIGRPNVCSNLQVLGVHTDGGFSEYVVIPRKNIHKILKRLSWNEAAMIEPFTIAAQVTNRAEITAEDTSFIMGAGPIGQCILQAVKRVGAKCFISDILEQRLVKAKDMGADFTINANTEDVREVVMRATSNVGIPVVIDKVILQFN